MHLLVHRAPLESIARATWRNKRNVHVASALPSGASAWAHSLANQCADRLPQDYHKDLYPYMECQRLPQYCNLDHKPRTCRSNRPLGNDKCLTVEQTLGHPFHNIVWERQYGLKHCSMSLQLATDTQFQTRERTWTTCPQASRWTILLHWFEPGAQGTEIRVCSKFNWMVARATSLW